MKEQIENNRIEDKFWPGRYNVFALAKGFRHEGYVYEDVRFKIFRKEITENEAISLLKPFGFSPNDEDWADIKTYAEETFSAEQAKDIRLILESYPDLTTYLKMAYKPTFAPSLVEAGIIAGVGGVCDIAKHSYLFRKASNFNLGIELWGYIDARAINRVDINQEQLLLKTIQKIENILTDLRADLDALYEDPFYIPPS